MNEWIWFSLFFAGLISLIFLSGFFRNKNWISPETSRKTVHIISGLSIFFSPFFFQTKFPVITLALIFVVFNFIAVRKNWFSETTETKRHLYGTVYFPISIAVLAYFYWETQVFIFQVSMLILALGDSVAAMVGKNTRDKREYVLYQSAKTIEGSSAMFLVSFVCVLGCGFYHILPEIPILHLFLISTIIAFFATLSEALFDGGLDNLFIPLVTALFLDYIIPDINVIFDIWVISVSLLPFIYLIYRLKFLTMGGSVAAYLMAVILLGMGGWDWMFPVLIFFIFSSLITWVSHHFRRSSGEVVEKSGARDPVQVFANGGPALIILLFAMNNLWPWAYLIFLVSVAAATADTWSTEIGQLFSKGKPFDPFKFKKVEKGLSGGMSVWGTVGGLLGSAVIASILFFQNEIYVERPQEMWMLIFASGFSGMIIDSFLGSFFQAKYKCTICSAETEKEKHCNYESRLQSGYVFVTNDTVNFLAISLSVFVGILSYNLFYKL